MASRTKRPLQPSDSAAIARALRSDSDLLRYAEWWVRRRIYGLSDQEARWLYDRYLDAYKRMVAALPTAYDGNGDPQLQQRAALLDQIEREMRALTGAVDTHLTNTILDAFRQGAMGRGWALDSATGAQVRVRLPMLPAEAIRALLLTEYVGQQWSATLMYDRDDFITRIKRGLTQSMIQGEGMAAAQRRVRDELGIQTDRRKGFKRNFYRTLLIARTEIMRASNLGALATYEQNQDVLNGWEWAAARDERVCRVCGALDGKTFGFGDPQLAPPSGSHPGCRCTPVPWIKDAFMADDARVRQTYAEWAAERGISWMDDGGLASQRSTTAHGLNRTSN